MEGKTREFAVWVTRVLFIVTIAGLMSATLNPLGFLWEGSPAASSLSGMAADFAGTAASMPFVKETYHIALATTAAVLCAAVIAGAAGALLSLFAKMRSAGITVMLVSGVVGFAASAAVFTVNLYQYDVLIVPDSGYSGGVSLIPAVWAAVMLICAVSASISRGGSIAGSGIGSLFRDSLRAVRGVRSLVALSLLTALVVAVEALSFPISANLFISFGFIFTSTIGLLFGPVCGMISGVVADLAGFMLFPKGEFFIGYTLNAILGGLIYGIVLYKADTRSKNFIVRVFTAKFLVNLIINIGLTTLWVSMFTGKAFMVLMPLRMVKNAIALPIETAVMFMVLRSLDAVMRKAGLNFNRGRGKVYKTE